MRSSRLAVSTVFLSKCLAVAPSLLPAHAWDSHMHVIDPARFPLSPDRDYTPKLATTSNATTFANSLGISHFVIVLPSVYGMDNRVLLDALNHFNGSARGVCVVDPDTVSNQTLAEYHAAGVRGVRLSAKEDGSDEEIVRSVRKFAAVAKIHDWVLQVRIPMKSFVVLEEVIPKLGVRVVVDHFAYPQVGSETNNTRDTIDPYQKTGFTEVIRLMRRKLLFVKISGPYLNSNMAPFYEDMRIVAETFMVNGPDMVVYGSDWPHTSNKEGNAAVGGRLNPADYKKIDDINIISKYKEWAGSEQQIRRLFVDNPRRLWQWEEFDS